MLAGVKPTFACLNLAFVFIGLSDLELVSSALEILVKALEGRDYLVLRHRRRNIDGFLLSGALRLYGGGFGHCSHP